MYDEFIKSPNFGYPRRGTTGRQGQKIIGVGVHISGGEYPGNIAWLTNPKSTASYTVLVKRDGKAVQLVDESNAQWAHGAIRSSKWPLLKSGVNPNLFTLAISRVGSNQNLWDPPQMDTIVRIIRAWSKKYNFPAEWPHVFGHKDIDAVNRWYCPGDPFLKELYVRLAMDEAIPGPVPDDVLWQVIAGTYADRQNAELVRGNLMRMGVTGVFLNPIKKRK